MSPVSFVIPSHSLVYVSFLSSLHIIHYKWAVYIESVMSAYFTDESMMVLASNQSVLKVRSASLESKINRHIE